MLNVELSMGQHTRFGSALLRFWYSDMAEQFKGLVFSMSGYPHNGGFHSLNIGAHPKDVAAWLDLFEETYPFVKEELDILREELKDKRSGRVIMRNALQAKDPKYCWQWRKCDNTFISPVESRSAAPALMSRPASLNKTVRHYED